MKEVQFFKTSFLHKPLIVIIYFLRALFYEEKIIRYLLKYPFSESECCTDGRLKCRFFSLIFKSAKAKQKKWRGQARREWRGKLGMIYPNLESFTWDRYVVRITKEKNAQSSGKTVKFRFFDVKYAVCFTYFVNNIFNDQNILYFYKLTIIWY